MVQMAHKVKECLPALLQQRPVNVTWPYISYLGQIDLTTPETLGYLTTPETLGNRNMYTNATWD